MALLPVPVAALSSTVAALLAPDQLASDIVFGVVVFIAVYIRRFGPRGRALGMVAFMAYFFNLFLRAGVHELPWMIVAVLVGTLSTFVYYRQPCRPIAQNACCKPPFARGGPGWPSWSIPPPTCCGRVASTSDAGDGSVPG